MGGAGTPRGRLASRAARRDFAAEVVQRLSEEYPDARCALNFANPFQLLVATILSAQCTDEKVNQVTPVLFARYPTAAALASAERQDVENIVHATGFFRQKSRSIQEVAAAVAHRQESDVPRTMAELLDFRGVARKTANVVLGVAYDVREGVVVDTHVGRLARRLGLTREHDPVKVEIDLMQLVPREHWVEVSHLLITHGRRVCDARKPLCAVCVLSDRCPSSDLPARALEPDAPLGGRSAS